MNEVWAAEDRAVLAGQGLDSFAALWARELTAVDEPNQGRGGFSQVFRLDVAGHGYYLKRQRDYLTRTLARPLGEPTFARESRNIRRYAELGIPALELAYYGERRDDQGWRAILLTRALDDWRDLDSWLRVWPHLAPDERQAVLVAVGELARQLHGAGQVHGCFYPKHLFLQRQGEGLVARLIDLEKTRPLLFGRRDRLRDLEPLLRRAPQWSEPDIARLLASYLDQSLDSAAVRDWSQRLAGRRRHKERKA